MPETEVRVTLGEIARGVEKASNSVDAARGEIQVLRQEVNARPDWEDVKRVERGLETKIAAAATPLEAKITALETATKTKDTLQDMSISKLEGWGNWATKAVGGLVIAAVLVRSGMG